MLDKKQEEEKWNVFVASQISHFLPEKIRVSCEKKNEIKANVIKW